MSAKVGMLLLLGAFCVGCSAAHQYAEVVEVDIDGWFTPVEVPFSVSDTTHSVDMQLVLRYDNTISADSVELLVSTIAPDGVEWREPFTLYTPQGEQSIQILETPFRRNIRWGQEGEYRVELHPQHNYCGVSAAGINIINRE